MLRFDKLLHILQGIAKLRGGKLVQSAPRARLIRSEQSAHRKLGRPRLCITRSRLREQFKLIGHRKAFSSQRLKYETVRARQNSSRQFPDFFLADPVSPSVCV